VVPERGERAATRVLDVVVYANVWVAAAAALLTAAASRAMDVAVAPAAVLLAFAGTLSVYALDRLLDLARDRATAPVRSAFVERHRRALLAEAAAAGAVGVLAASAIGRAAAVVAAAVLALGLAHRWLKRIALGKAVYIAGAWTAVVAGVPALAARDARHAALVCAVLFTTLVGNAVASSARDVEALAALLGPRRMVAIARALVLLALLMALFAPWPVARLAPVPLATLVALQWWRPGERWGLFVVDGALVVGGVVALLL
jgi:4-hydroxybenzoate polyprenyltransferase